MIILGIKGGNGQHNACFSALDTDRDDILFASEEDRFNGLKQTDCFPIGSINEFFKQYPTSIDDISHVAIAGSMSEYLFDYADYINDLYNETGKIEFKKKYDEIVYESLKLNYLKKFIAERFPQASIIDVNHHKTHAALAFNCSKFDSSAIFTADGLGEWQSTTFGYGNNGRIYNIASLSYPNSIGFMYTMICNYIGFYGPNPEGKVMALASYGKPKYLKRMQEFFPKDDKFNFHFNRNKKWKLLENCGPLLQDDDLFLEAFDNTPQRKEDQKLTQVHFDIAASIQKHFENVIIELARDLYDETMSDNICVGGGCFLNSVVNNMILENTKFKNIYVNPASNDGGCALGAALFVKHNIMGNSKKTLFNNAYLGYEIKNESCKLICNNSKIRYKELDNLHEEVARLLNDGKIIAWSQGRTEIGPRALCARSILVSPTGNETIDNLNKKVKFREWFRPFAPVVMQEYCNEYFDIDRESPYMLFVCKAKEENKNKIPAVLHVDDTARVQTLTREQNSSMYRLLEEFYKLTSIPILLNTSFNIGGESIVNDEIDSIRCFFYTEIDYLVLGNLLISKEDNQEILKEIKNASRNSYYNSRYYQYKERFADFIEENNIFFSNEQFWYKNEK